MKEVDFWLIEKLAIGCIRDTLSADKLTEKKPLLSH